MEKVSAVWQCVEAKKALGIGLSDGVWETPEIAYGEFHSADRHTALLEAEGFRVTENLAGIPTAMMGEAGEGGPVIAILGELDALPGLSQKAGVAQPCPVETGGPGHGCGHNLLGGGALLAAIGVKDWLAANHIPGRVRYYGCPAEEGGAAKTFLVRAGAFSDVDAAISWHPACFNTIDPAQALANTRMDFEFFGRASHASAAPHLGRSALDAVELMNVGVNYMREHMPSGDRIHYAMLDSGGIAPNVVQAYAKVRYAIRSTDTPGMLALIERVKKVAEGAALMTETAMKSHVFSAISNILTNPPMEKAGQRNLEALGPVPFDDADHAFAAKIQASLGPSDIDNAYRRIGLPRGDAPLFAGAVPWGTNGLPMIGSTDLGDVSWAVPTVQFRGATWAIGTPGHSWQVTAQGKSPAAHKAMVHIAKAMAQTAADLVTDPGLLAEAQADHRARLDKTPYVCPIPDDVDPPIRPRPAV